MNNLPAASDVNASEDPLSSLHQDRNTLGSEAWRAALALALIVLAAMTVRLVFAALPRVVRWDEAAYQLIARNLRDGLGYRELVGASDLQQPPMVAYLSLAGQWLRLPTVWVTAGIIQVLLGSLILLPVYGLAFELSGRRRRVGLIAALLAAVHPALAVSPLYWGTMTEPPYVLFILCGLYASWRTANAADPGGGRWGWTAVLGIAFGLAYLTRPEAVAYFLLMLSFVLIYRVWRQPGRPLRGRVRQALTSTLALTLTSVVLFALVAAPYVVYVHRITGRWALSGKQGITIDIAWALVNHDQAAHDRAAASLDPAGKEIMWLSPAQYDRSLIGWVRENPRRFVWQVRRNIADTMQALFHADLLNPLLVALVALGLFARPWTRARLRQELLLWLALVPLASLWVFFVLSRFLAIVIPICLIWAAIGLAYLGDWMRATGANVVVSRPWAGRRALARAAVALPLAVAVTAFLLAGAGLARREIPGQPFWRVEVAAWLAAQMPPDTPVMTRDTELALYADLQQVAFPYAEWPQVLAYAQARDARFLVVEKSEITNLRPFLTPLLDTANPPPGVRFVRELSAQGQTTLVYEFTGVP